LRLKATNGTNPRNDFGPVDFSGVGVQKKEIETINP